jgi:hypothetical protein
MAKPLHDSDPRKRKDFWCSTCKQMHSPSENHPLCATGEPHLHIPFPADLYIDFKGWRFTAPFHCMGCGIVVCPQQWAFSRSCGGCDVSHSHTRRLSVFDRRFFSGPAEVIDIKDPYFLEEERFLDPATADKYPVLNPSKPLIPQTWGCDQSDAIEKLGRPCKCTCLHTVHPVANHAFGCPETSSVSAIYSPGTK